MTYAYPPSPTSDDGASPSRPPPLSQRLRALQHDIASLEAELSDPSNPLLHGDNGEMVDPGVLMKGLVDVRGRLEKVSKTRDGRGKLVDRVLGGKESATIQEVLTGEKRTREESETPNVAEMDRRVGELERLVGSSGTTLDEVCLIKARTATILTRYLPVVAASSSTSASHHTIEQPNYITYPTTTH